MNNTEIKKYRRRVSDKRVNVVWKSFQLYHSAFYNLDPRQIRAVLEADAEVIEGYYLEDSTYIYIKATDNLKPSYAIQKRRFHAEWEEITE